MLGVRDDSWLGQLGTAPDSGVRGGTAGERGGKASGQRPQGGHGPGRGRWGRRAGVCGCSREEGRSELEPGLERQGTPTCRETQDGLTEWPAG